MNKGLKRAAEALCYECCSERKDCGAPACPLYTFRRYNRENSDASVPWFELPKSQWAEASQVAHREGRLIPRVERELTPAQKAAQERFAEARSCTK